jgi:uncharacterized protein (DUF885 family)
MLRAFSGNLARILVAVLVLLPVAGVEAAKKKPAKARAPTEIQVRHDKLRAVADDYWEFFLRENPEYATVLGEYQYNDRLTDYSLAHAEDVRAQTAALFQRARSIDTTGLSDADRLDQLLLVRTLADRLESFRLNNHEMVIDQMNGVHLAFPQIASYAPFDTVQHYRDYITRLNAIPVAIDQVIERSRAGLQDGLMQPRYLLEKTVVQSATLANAAGASSPFATPAASIPASFPAADREQLRTDILAAVDGKVRPAYGRLRSFLAEEYAPKGREEVGVWSLPDGDARYRYAIHAQTTTPLSSDQIHAIGLAQVADLEQQITALAKSAGYADRKSFEQAVFADPKLHGTSRQQVLDRYSHFIGQMEPKLPQLFGLLPKSKLVVTNVPAYMEKESSTQYIAGTPDGSRPGPVTTCRSRSRRSCRGCIRSTRRSLSTTTPTSKAGRCIPNAWARRSASTRIPRATSGGCAASCIARCGSWSTPAFTASTGRGNRWSITGMNTCRRHPMPKWTVTLRGPARRSATSWVS